MAIIRTRGRRLRAGGHRASRRSLTLAAAVAAVTAGLASPVQAGLQPTAPTIAAVPIGNGAYNVAVDAATGTAFVSNSWDATVSVIDEKTRRVSSTIPVGGGPAGLAVDPTTATAFVGNGYDGTVSVIDEKTAKVTRTIKVDGFPNGVAVDPSRSRVYVTNSGTKGGPGSVSVIDEATYTVIATIWLGKYPAGVAVDTGRGRVYVTDSHSETVSVIDEQTEKVTQTISLSTPASVAVAQPSGKVFVVGGYVSRIYTLDQTGTLTHTATPPWSFGGVAVNPVTHTVWVAHSSRPGSAYVLSIATGKVVRTIKVQHRTNGVAVDSSTGAVFLTSAFSNTLLIVSEGVPAG